jgi:transketolase
LAPFILGSDDQKVPNFTPADQGFVIGKAIEMRADIDVTIFATGHLVWKAIEATKILTNQVLDVELINIHNY